MDDLEKLLSTNEVAEILSISAASVRDLVRHGEIAFINTGRSLVRRRTAFHPRDVQDFINRRRTRESLAQGVKTLRLTMAVNGLDKEASREQLLSERHNRNQHARLEFERATAARNDFESRLKEKASRAEILKGQIAANVVKRKARSDAKVVESEARARGTD